MDPNIAGSGLFNAIGDVFTNDKDFAGEAGRLVIFTIASMAGMACHWVKLRLRNQVACSASKFFFKMDLRATINAIMATMFFVACAWVLGIVTAGSSLTIIFQGLLGGYCANSLFNSDGSTKSLTTLAKEALSSFQDSPDDKPPAPTVTSEQTTVHAEGATATASSTQVVQIVKDPVPERIVDSRGSNVPLPPMMQPPHAGTFSNEPPKPPEV